LKTFFQPAAEIFCRSSPTGDFTFHLFPTMSDAIPFPKADMESRRRRHIRPYVEEHKNDALIWKNGINSSLDFFQAIADPPTPPTFPSCLRELTECY